MKKNLLLLCAALIFGSANARANFEQGALDYALGNYSQAMEIMTALAMTEDHALAQYYLGVMYANGQGTKQNFKLAAQWLRGAAEKGLAQAQYRLGRLYANGEGVPQDQEFAYAWYSVASKLGNHDANAALAGVAQALNPEERGQADKLAQEYITKYGSTPKSTARVK